MTRVRLVAGCIAAAALVSVPACAGGSGEAEGANLRLVVPDNNIRLEGAECAGARPFQYIHAGATFTVESSDGAVVLEGELPAGHAENADPSVEWGVEKIPTVCVMDLIVTDLAGAETYRLRLEQGAPLEFEAKDLSEDEPLQLIAQ